MYIDRIHIQNIRCFEELNIKLDLRGEKVPWTLILGDNATGKTALLRSIAMGLCDESSAAGLMKEAEAGYVRRGQSDPGKIVIELRRDLGGRQKYRIETTIDKVITKKGVRHERLRQRTSPSKTFPWNEIFVSAYGAGRGTAGTGDIAGYSPINAVYNMFNYGEGLQNPELTIRRIKEHKSQEQAVQTLNALMRTDQVRLDGRSGLLIDGPWGKGMPLRDLADGYRSTFLWVADFLGWALSYDTSLRSSHDVRGILLIDEIEQHLHATWQRALVNELRNYFPNVQFIATTHSPLIASSVGQINLDPTAPRDKLLLLELVERNRIKQHELPQMRGMRVDQILASRAFKYLIEADPEVERILVEASQLAGKGKSRTKNDERRYQKLKVMIGRINLSGATTVVQREIEEESFAENKARIKNLENRRDKKHD